MRVTCAGCGRKFDSSEGDFILKCYVSYPKGNSRDTAYCGLAFCSIKCIKSFAKDVKKHARSFKRHPLLALKERIERRRYDAMFPHPGLRDGKGESN